MVAPVHKLPLVTMMASVDAGAVAEPAGKEGLAQLTAALLTEGTRRYDGAELALRFERLGASIESSADWDAAAVSVTSMASQADAVLPLLMEVLLEPAFRERELERLKGERLAELLQLRSEPRGLADERFARVVYREGSRFSKPEGGDEQSVAAITRDDVELFHSQRFVSASTTILIVGDITSDRACNLVEESAAAWRGVAPARVIADDGPGRTNRSLWVIDKSDAPQSELRIGHVGVPRRHPDYFPLVVMNALLGGLFNSRINLNLREKHAFTYGAFSGFDWRRQAGPFVVHPAVRSDVTAAAVREVLFEIEGLRQREVGLDELSLATNYLAGVFPIRFETTTAMAAALAGLVIHGLPDDYFDSYRSLVRAVTAPDVLRVARECVRPDELQILAVGDQRAIREPLVSLGLGPVSIHPVTP
jgi:zinc protease